MKVLDDDDDDDVGWEWNELSKELHMKGSYYMDSLNVVTNDLNKIRIT